MARDETPAPTALIEDLLEKVYGMREALFIGLPSLEGVETGEALRWLDQFFKAIGEMKSLPLGLLPLVHIGEMVRFLISMEKGLGSLKDFSPEDVKDPQTAWDALFERVKGNFTKNYENISPYFEALKG